MNERAATTHTLVVERVMPHSPENILRALTQGPLIEEWLMKTISSNRLVTIDLASDLLLCWDGRAQQTFPGARMPRQVDYYFSLQSPWAYIGHRFFRDRSRPTTSR